MAPKNNYDDEALARALQIEYEREYRRRSMQQHLEVNEVTTNSRRSSSRNVNPASTSAPLPPPPIVVPSAPLSNSFYEDDDGNNDFLNTGVGTHRGTTTTASPQQAFPRPSFVMAEDRFGSSVEISDEEYARRLEIEMIEEERRRNQRKQHLQQQRDSYRAASSTNRASVATRTQEFPSQHHTRNSSLSSPIVPPVSNRRDSSHRSPNTNSIHENRIPAAIPRSSNRNNTMNGYPVVTGTALLYTDEELARRLEQEMRDEELARQAFVEEQIRQSSIAAQSMRNTADRGRQRPSSGRSCCCRLFQCILMLIIAGAAALLLLFFLFNPDEVGNFIPNPDEFREEDPFNTANKEDANLWRTRGGAGLELVVVNALDDVWHPYFFTAVDEWDKGSPDTLSLTIEDSVPDSTCNAIDGKLKVCNGNYGETNWRGINKILLENGWIYSSAARMNEFYTTNNDGDQRQYTMCHEIGHGFGLPHTDENFFNKDLGNCMDYTNNPSTNMQPAYANFKFLAQLYGTIDGSPVPTDDNTAVESAASSSTEAPVNEAKENSKEKEKNKGENRRRLLPSHVATALNDIDVMIDNGTYRSESHGWRILHESDYGHAYEMDLGHGFSLQIHALNP